MRGEDLDVGAHGGQRRPQLVLGGGGEVAGGRQGALALGAGELDAVQEAAEGVGEVGGLGGPAHGPCGEGGAVGRPGASAQLGGAVPQLAQRPDRPPGQQPAEAGRSQGGQRGDQHRHRAHPR